MVLLSTAAGLALAAGDVDGAVDLGRTADTEGTELGVEREVPLIRAVLARALLASGEVAPAAKVRWKRAITVALGMEFQYPLAIALESAAIVLFPPAVLRTSSGRTAPCGDRDLVAALLDAAAGIRARGGPAGSRHPFGPDAPSGSGRSPPPTGPLDVPPEVAGSAPRAITALAAIRPVAAP